MMLRIQINKREQGLRARDVGLVTGFVRTFAVHCGALVFVTVFTFVGS
jgi:hypothetical protein